SSGIKGEPIRTTRDRHGCRRGDTETLKPPEEDAQTRDVVPADLPAAATEVSGVEEFVECRTGFGCPIDVSQISQAADAGARKRSDQTFGKLERGDIVVFRLRNADRRVEAMPGPAESAEKFHDL